MRRPTRRQLEYALFGVALAAIAALFALLAVATLRAGHPPGLPRDAAAVHPLRFWKVVVVSGGLAAAAATLSLGAFWLAITDRSDPRGVEKYLLSRGKGAAAPTPRSRPLQSP
jgi:hypothetical protein